MRRDQEGFDRDACPPYPWEAVDSFVGRAVANVHGADTNEFPRPTQ